MSDSFGLEKQLSARRQGQYDAFARGLISCVFCDLKDKYVLCEKDGLVATVNIFPYIDGQLLILPKRHIERLDEVTPEEWATNYYLSQLAVSVLRKQMGIEGVWLILREGPTGKASGKTVSHLHWNVMPYIEGINTWHYQDITIAPGELAVKLRPHFQNDGA